MKKFREFVSERIVVDYDNEKVEYIDYHGNEYKVVKVISKDEVLVDGPEGEEVLEIEDIKSQDDNVRGIK